MKKSTKIIIACLSAAIIGGAAIIYYKNANKEKVELGKIDYEAFDPEKKEIKESDEVDDLVENDENTNANEAPNEVNEDLNASYKANEEDLAAADKADFGQYPFKKFKKENAKLMHSPDEQRFKKTLVENFDKLIEALEKAKEDQEGGITQEVLDILQVYFNVSDTAQIAPIVNDVMEGKKLTLSEDDIYVFKNDDYSYQTNKPVVAGIRCECNGGEIAYYVQGLAIMTPDYEGFTPFAIVPAD